MKTTPILLLVAILFLLIMASCAAGPNPSVNMPDAGGSVAGFWLGLWHGIIAPVTFIISLFTDSVHFYDVNNNGWPYNLGFILGILCIGGGGGGGATYKRKKK